MPETEDEKMLRLAQALTRHTRSGAIEWERRWAAGDSDFDILRFEYSTSNSTVSIDNSGGSAGSGWIVMMVRDSLGTVVEKLEMASDTEYEFDVVLKNLFEAARRQVLKVDQTLDELIAEVEKLDPPF
jgi:hypothetical protein